MSISNFIYECWTLNLLSQPSSPPLKFTPLACYKRCIYELIVPQSNIEKDWFPWKHNISLLCKFIHQYYTLTNLVPFMSMKGTSFGVAVKCQWGFRDISVEYTDIFCSISDNCRLIIEWLSTDYQATINWYDHCHIDHYIDPTLPTIHMIQRTNLYKFVLKKWILSFFISLIIYGCKNFSKLIHREHINKSQTVQKVETECRKLKWCNNKS